MTGVESEWSNQGETLSIIHDRFAYHFTKIDTTRVKLKTIDVLSSNHSLPGRYLPELPDAVHDELASNDLALA